MTCRLLSQSDRACRLVLAVGFGVSLPGSLIRAAEPGSGVIPSFDPERYEQLWTRSPFGIDTAPTAVVDDGPSFAANLAISGIMRGRGNESITLVNVETREFFRATREGGGDYQLLSLTVDRDRRKSRAVIARAGETAEVRFPEKKASPIAGQPFRAVGGAGRTSREGSSREGSGPSSPSGGGLAAAERNGAMEARPGPVASSGARATPPRNPPRRRVILPRQR